MLFRRFRGYSAKEESQGRAFGVLLLTLGLGPLLLFMAKHHYGQLAAAGLIVIRGKRGVTTLAGSDASWLLGLETVLGAVLIGVGLWWVRERLRRFPY